MYDPEFLRGCCDGGGLQPEHRTLVGHGSRARGNHQCNSDLDIAIDIGLALITQNDRQRPKNLDASRRSNTARVREFQPYRLTHVGSRMFG